MEMDDIKVKEEDLVICVGGGFFGSRAAKVAKERGARVIVIDKEEKCLAKELNLCDEVRSVVRRANTDTDTDTDTGTGTGNKSKSASGIEIDIDIEPIINSSSKKTTLWIGDGIEVLKSILKKRVPELIVPSIQGHLMGKLSKSWLQGKGMKVKESGFYLSEVLKGIPPRLVLEKNEEEGILITSYMLTGKTCKLGCVQQKKCPVTGIEKPAKMYNLLKFALASSSVEYFHVLISRQIGKGTVGSVGAVRGKDVIKALKYFEKNLSFTKRSSADKFFAVATSCPCHGILNLFTTQPQPNFLF